MDYLEKRRATTDRVVSWEGKDILEMDKPELIAIIDRLANSERSMMRQHTHDLAMLTSIKEPPRKSFWRQLFS